MLFYLLVFGQGTVKPFGKAAINTAHVLEICRELQPLQTPILAELLECSCCCLPPADCRPMSPAPSWLEVDRPLASHVCRAAAGQPVSADAMGPRAGEFVQGEAQ